VCLTAARRRSYRALGRRLASLQPPVSRIYVSPLGRCVQTAAAAAAELGAFACKEAVLRSSEYQRVHARSSGVDALHVEPSLVEVMDEEWYECWRCAKGDPRGTAAAGTLFHSAEELRRSVSPLVDPSYAPLLHASAFTATQAEPESWSALRARMDACVRALCARHPGESVLFVTHGGPIDSVLPSLDSRLPRTRRVDYTSLSLLLEDAESERGFCCLVHSCSQHIEGVEAEGAPAA